MRRGLLLLVAGGFSVALQGSSLALPWTTVERAPARGGEDGLALLERAARAANDLSYHGTQMVSSWALDGSTSALIEVAHEGGAGLLLRVAPTPQSPGGAVYRDEEGAVPDVVGFAKGTLALLADNYLVDVEGTGEVAGRRAYVVAVHRRGAAPTARFWIDAATALPLRREVLDEAGRTVRESAFLSLVVGETRVSDAVAESAGTMPVVAGAPADVAALRRDGWRVADRLGKSLELFAARLLASPDGPTLQLTYSDGVSTASVFQQRGRLDAGGVAGWERTRVGHGDVWVQRAFPRRVVWSGRGTVYTVVADCPEGTLDALVAAFPHGEAGRGFRARLRHGVARVGSWLNPFA